MLASMRSSDSSMEEIAPKSSMNDSTFSLNKSGPSGEPETVLHIDRDKISARNRERSPLLRLPGEIRNQIYQYLMSGHIVYPSWRLHDDGSRQIVTYCAPEPADYANEGTHLWPLVPSLKYASRQLHAEIGNVPLAETLVRYKPGPTLWVSWLHTWSKEQKRAVKDVQILVQGFWRMPLDTIFLSFKDIKLLPNLRTVYIKEAFNPLDEAARQRIVARAQPNWQIVFERG